MHHKILILAALASLASCEPPAPGYNYQRPSYQPPRLRNTYNSPTNSYLPPSTGFNPPPPQPSYAPPSPSYGAPSYDSGYSGQDSYNHGHDHHDHGHDNEVPKSYEFGYSVKDAQSGNDYGRQETSDGNTVRGEYRVALPDGRTQIVTYHADWKTGFHADVRYEGEARYPEPSYNKPQAQGGYSYNAPSDFSGSLSGLQGPQAPSTQYGPPGYH